MDRNAVSDEALTSVTASTFLKLLWVKNQINDDHNDAEENTLEESATYALFITNEPIHVQQQVKTILHTFESNKIIRHQRRHGKAHLHRYEECKMLY